MSITINNNCKLSETKEEININKYTNSNKKRLSLNWMDNLKSIKRKSISSEYSHIFAKKEQKMEEMIESAKIHREANRPLMKIKEFDGNTKFCPCCYLPANDNIYLKTYSFCDNTDKYAEYGSGTSLYFS